MRKLSLSLIAIALSLTMSGCILDYFYAKPADGGPSPAQKVQAVVRQFPYGEVISSVIGLVGLGFGGHKVVKHVRRKRAEKRTKKMMAGH
jgi:hypothetical protein